MHLPLAAALRSLVFAALAATVVAQPKLTVTVEHTLDAARPSETITVPWREVNQALPGALLQRIAVKDAAGRVLPYQVTNVAPQAKDPKNEGIAYGDLIFQHDFAAGEKRATFTVEKIDTVAPVFPAKVFARYIGERLDDFAWENDKVAHRTYGQALAEPVPAGVAIKEVLVTSGLDIWAKRVPYLIVDRWYNKGHDHYHDDQGEGMDLYGVGPSRGCGGTGIWDGQRLHVGRNYRAWKVIANGPIRAIFELTYDTWMANGVMVSEVKRFTVDAGHQLDRIESTFAITGAKEVVVGLGLGKHKTATSVVLPNEKAGWLGLWETYPTEEEGQLGTGIVLAAPATGLVEDDLNHLLLTKARPGEPVRYYAGAAWARAGEITSAAAWQAYLTAAAARLAAPVTVTVSTTP